MKKSLLVLALVIGSASNAKTNPLENSTNKTTTVTCSDFSITVQATNILCNGINDGQIVVNTLGGTPPYLYLISRDGFTTPSLFTLSNTFVYNSLGSGIYTITVRDINNCSEFATLEITEPPAPLTTSASVIDGCAAFGSITMTATGGTAPYTYSLDGASFSTNNIFAVETSGEYTISVKDANGCQADANVNVNTTNVNTSIAQLDATLTSNESGADSYQWFDCNTPNTPIPNATNNSFQPERDGNYAVTIFKGNCEVISECFIYKTLTSSLNSSLKPTITAYPNPTRNNLNISFNIIQETILLELFNTNGKKVFDKDYRNSSAIKFPVKVSEGIYFLNITTKKHYETIKIRVQ